MTKDMVTGITLKYVADRLARRSPERREGAGSIQAAVALVLALGDSHRLELLLIKRAEHPGDPWSGQMALPGGRRDPEDQDLLATVARETREEVGVALAPDRLLGELDDLHPRTPLLPPVVVRPFVFGLSHRPTVHASREVALHVWVSLDELASGQTRTEIAIPGRNQRFPAYQVGAHVVWGMTERIIAPFIELLM
jgi:8-oxo-dGTP pyrophosphatase MutT (NUDIX family)